MDLIDSHLHVNYGGLSLRDIISYLDKERIDRCWLLSWEEVNHGKWIYEHLSIEDIYEAYLKYPTRIIPFYAPDPHRIDATIQFEKWYQKGIKGSGELKATLNWNSAEIKSLLSTIQKLKLPVVFHMEESKTLDIPYSEAFFDKILFYGLRTKKGLFKIPQGLLRFLVEHYEPLKRRTSSTFFFPGYMLDMVSLESALVQYPDINFVAHGLMFWKHISLDASQRKEELPSGPVTGEGIIWRLLNKYPNLYADTSGPSGFNALTRDADNAKKFINTFKNKLIYGTDNLMKHQKDFINSLGLSNSTLKQIYGENASRLIKS
jgi:uncharacterized protein